jgi:hypothetical protein
VSWDISLCDPATGDVLELPDNVEQPRGGTYAIGGCRAELNVTYNYSPHYFRTISGTDGIRSLNGMSAEQSLPIIRKAIDELRDDVDPYDYWKPTEGNARRALLDLEALAKACPHGFWEVT